MSQVTVKCPHCDAEQEDTLDVLDVGAHEIRCPDCGKTFVVHLVECPRCAADIVSTGLPPATCDQCGADLSDDGRDERS